MTKGVLMPDPERPPVMHCTYCGAPVMLVWLHDLLPELVKTWPKNKPLPGMIWGQDVDVVCYCCSYPGCTHKEGQVAA